MTVYTVVHYGDRLNVRIQTPVLLVVDRDADSTAVKRYVRQELKSRLSRNVEVRVHYRDLDSVGEYRMREPLDVWARNRELVEARKRSMAMAQLKKGKKS